MSASPAGGPPSGPASTTPNAGTPNIVQRRRQHTNPLVSKKKPLKKPPSSLGRPGPNGITRATSTKPPPASSSKKAAEAPDPDDDPSTYVEYPLFASKKALLQGLRFHAMRLISEQEVDPWDESQFTRPLRLHRRYARDQKLEPVVPENGVDDKEREKEEIRKAERQAQKEANQAQIAPMEKAAQKKKLPQFKKKVEDVFYPQDTPEAQKRAKLRYEEGRPWHLEDFDSKNTWIGSYEEPLSETHAMLSLDSGHFRMVPLEKWYRFIPTNRYKTYTLDEAEKHMAKKVKDSRWFSENSMTDEQRQRMESERQNRLQRGRVGMRGEKSGPRKDDEDDERPEMVHDADEIDYNAEDEFQDDDEGGFFLGDEEEVKESERKIRQEMLGANIFAGTGVKEEKDWDAEEEAEKKKEAEERKKKRKLYRALVKNERKFEYDSQSDHPYSEESDESSSDELFKDPEIKKEEDKNAVANGDKPISGASSVGTNTPSGRAEKHSDAMRNSQITGSGLKRPGSPNLSEASGSESSRKRVKKEANGQPSRPMSPSVMGKGSMSREFTSMPLHTYALMTSPQRPHSIDVVELAQAQTPKPPGPNVPDLACASHHPGMPPRPALRPDHELEVHRRGRAVLPAQINHSLPPTKSAPPFLRMVSPSQISSVASEAVCRARRRRTRLSLRWSSGWAAMRLVIDR